MVNKTNEADIEDTNWNKDDIVVFDFMWADKLTILQCTNSMQQYIHDTQCLLFRCMGQLLSHKQTYFDVYLFVAPKLTVIKLLCSKLAVACQSALVLQVHSQYNRLATCTRIDLQHKMASTDHVYT